MAARSSDSPTNGNCDFTRKETVILKSSWNLAEDPQLFSHSLMFRFCMKFETSVRIWHYNGLFPPLDHGTSHKKSVSFIELNEIQIMIIKI